MTNRYHSECASGTCLYPERETSTVALSGQHSYFQCSVVGVKNLLNHLQVTYYCNLLRMRIRSAQSKMASERHYFDLDELAQEEDGDTDPDFDEEEEEEVEIWDLTAPPEHE